MGFFYVFLEKFFFGWEALNQNKVFGHPSKKNLLKKLIVTKFNVR